MKLAPVDYLILALYFSFVLGIGWKLRKSVSSLGRLPPAEGDLAAIDALLGIRL